MNTNDNPLYDNPPSVKVERTIKHDVVGNKRTDRVVITMTGEQADDLRELLEAVDAHKDDTLPVICHHAQCHRTLDELRRELALTRPGE